MGYGNHNIYSDRTITEFKLSSEPVFSIHQDKTYEILRSFECEGKNLLFGHSKDGTCFVSEYNPASGLISYTFKQSVEDWRVFFPIIIIFKQRFSHDDTEQTYLFATCSKRWMLRKYHPQTHAFDIAQGTGEFEEEFVAGDVFAKRTYTSFWDNQYDEVKYFIGISKQRKTHIYKFIEGGTGFLESLLKTFGPIVSLEENSKTAEWQHLYTTVNTFRLSNKVYLFAQANEVPYLTNRRCFVADLKESEGQMNFNHELTTASWNHFYSFTKILTFTSDGTEDVKILFAFDSSSNRWFASQFRSNGFTDEISSGYIPNGAKVLEVVQFQDVEYVLAADKANNFLVYKIDWYSHDQRFDHGRSYTIQK